MVVIIGENEHGIAVEEQPELQIEIESSPETIYTKTKILERLSQTEQQLNQLAAEPEVTKEIPSSELYGKSNYDIISQDIDFFITTAVIYMTLMILIMGLYVLRNSVKKRKD